MIYHSCDRVIVESQCENSDLWWGDGGAEPGSTEGTGSLREAGEERAGAREIAETIQEISLCSCIFQNDIPLLRV